LKTENLEQREYFYDSRELNGGTGGDNASNKRNINKKGESLKNEPRTG
jgi:hypothetical protein